jgi:hypothetical protein
VLHRLLQLFGDQSASMNFTLRFIAHSVRLYYRAAPEFYRGAHQAEAGPAFVVCLRRRDLGGGGRPANRIVKVGRRAFDTCET